MYLYTLFIAGKKVIIHTSIKNCLKIFMLESYLEAERAVAECTDVYHIYMFKNEKVVEGFIKEDDKISNSTCTVYISNRLEDPKGIIIEKKKRNKTAKYIVIGSNENSQIIFLRSIIIKLFFTYMVNLNCYPLHCSVVSRNNKGYMFLADSLGGKSTLYFTFATYGAKEYSVLTDDTILCNSSDGHIRGYTLPLKPSLRKGTIDYLRPMHKYSTEFNNPNYSIEDQIYINIDKTEKAKVEYESRICAAFFVYYTDSFLIERITDIEVIKKRIAIIICGYKARKVDLEFVSFLNEITSKINFYRLGIPKDLEDFYIKFQEWENNEHD